MCVFVATKITIIVRIHLKFALYFLAYCFGKDINGKIKYQINWGQYTPLTAKKESNQQTKIYP